MGLKVAWNKEQTASVVLAKIKEFTVTQNTQDNKFSVRGWYNRENSFLFGENFVDLAAAQAFLSNIHNKM